MRRLGQARDGRPDRADTKRSRFVGTALVAVLAALLCATGCGDGPVAVSALYRIADSTRYVNAPGTPFAVATLWSHGVLNVAAEVHHIVEQRFPAETCVVRGVVVFRGTVTAGSLVGAAPSTTFPSGSYTASGSPSELHVEATVNASCPCGDAVVPLSLTLVPETP